MSRRDRKRRYEVLWVPNLAQDWLAASTAPRSPTRTEVSFPAPRDAAAPEPSLRVGANALDGHLQAAARSLWLR